MIRWWASVVGLWRLGLGLLGMTTSTGSPDVWS
jgi:hypothetical protein